MHGHSRLKSSVFFTAAILLCAGGTGCVFEGGHVLRRTWFDHNTLGTPAIFIDETHHLPLPSSRTDQLRWMYNQHPTLTYDKDGLQAYHEKQQSKSWLLHANEHHSENGEAETNPEKPFPHPAPRVESQPSRDRGKIAPGFVPPAPTPLGDLKKKNKPKKTKTPALKSPPGTGKKKIPKEPIALRWYP